MVCYPGRFQPWGIIVFQPYRIFSKYIVGEGPSNFYIHLSTINKGTQHVSYQDLLIIHVCHTRWSIHQIWVLQIFHPHKKISRTLYPSSNPPNNTESPRLRIILYEISISIIFPGGIIIFSYLVLDASHTLTEKLSMHVVTGLCWTFPNKTLSNNMEFLSLPW